MSVLQTFRLASGGAIDRSRPLAFLCNGRAYQGCVGDTLASALLANGVRVVGRSFKYHRPRGIMSAGLEETNALFRVEAEGVAVPLVRATQQPLLDGLVATTENAWPGVGFDVGRLLDYTHRLWPAGFYNKTFKWPSWHSYEGLIRRSAGSGRVPTGPDPTQYFQHNLHCDVLVIGGGVAGLGAALAAAATGARVVLAELEPRFGGSVPHVSQTVDGKPVAAWIDEVVTRLQAMPNVRLLHETMVAGAFDHATFLAVDRSSFRSRAGPTERLWTVRARRVVLATGAIEQPLVFEHNDRPGVLLADAARRYLQQYAVAVGRSVLVATNNDSAYTTAFALHDAGVKVPAIVDTRPAAAPALVTHAARRGIATLQACFVISTRGSRGVRSVRVGPCTAGGGATSVRSIECDAVAMSGGWMPTVHLYSQAGGSLRFDAESGAFAPRGDLRNWHAAGAANGRFSFEDAVREGTDAGLAAARSLHEPLVASAKTRRSDDAEGSRPPWRTPAGDTSRQWLDFRHDATVADIELAVRENYTSVEHAKRYTTAGMSIDQGKTANLNAHALLAELTNRTMAQTGTTTFRPLYSPVSLGAIAAGQQRDLYSPTRLLAAHAWHRAAGAAFDEYGGWQRPACYPRAGETRDTAIAREVLAVRRSVGVFDGSPLGKIEVKGPDAAEFLHRLYVNNVHSLAQGRVRYGVMLNENGIVIDDGVFACMAPGHYLVCPTSGGADRIAAWLDEWHQCEWPELRLVLLPVTTQWAVCTVAGPQARAVLQALSCDIDLSPAALPHLGFAQGRLYGLPARIQRVSFTGEASFEVSVPARSASRVFEFVARAGASHGITPFGVESLLVLRTEKGYLHVGVDSDGTTNPFDLGLGAIVDRKQGDFVGRRSLQRARDRASGRRQLVGLEPVVASDTLVAGAHLVARDGGRRRSEGFVTSACRSPTLGRSIGLGLLERGFARKGETVTVFDAGREIEARIVAPVFYDPSGERLHG